VRAETCAPFGIVLVAGRSKSDAWECISGM
jgi:hypothetical protein